LYTTTLLLAGKKIITALSKYRVLIVVAGLSVVSLLLQVHFAVLALLTNTPKEVFFNGMPKLKFVEIVKL
jgi:hypothetical protein